MESLGEVLRRVSRRAVAAVDAFDGVDAVEGGEPLAGVDGVEVLPVCGVCGGRGFVTVRVPVGDELFGRALPCLECRAGAFGEGALDSLRRTSNLGGLLGVRFEDTLAGGPLGGRGGDGLFGRALEVCGDYADSPEGWLVLAGPAGSGKTHLAACVVNRRVELGEPALFVGCADLLDRLRAGYGAGVEGGAGVVAERVLDVPLLAVDAVGSQYETGWSDEKLLQVFDHRYRLRLPTVVTLAVPLARVSQESLRFRLSEAGGLARVLELGRVGVSARSGLGDIELALAARMSFESFDFGGGDQVGDGPRSLEEAYLAAVRYSRSLDGWLVLGGDPGCGKTHLAVSVALAARARGVRTMFAYVPSLLDHLRAAFAPGSELSYDDVFDEVQSVELLVLDGLGSERSTPWVEEKLGQLVTLRHAARRATVVTTSATVSELSGNRPAVWSRLMDRGLVDYRVIASGSYHG